MKLSIKLCLAVGFLCVASVWAGEKMSAEKTPEKETRRERVKATIKKLEEKGLSEAEILRVIFAGEKILSQYYNGVRDRLELTPMRVYYYLHLGVSQINVRGHGVRNYGIFIYDEDVEKFSSILRKYLKWEKIAIAEKVKVNKEIGRVSNNRMFWFYGDKQYGDDNVEITFKMFSDSVEKHYLVIIFPQLQDEKVLAAKSTGKKKNPNVSVTVTVTVNGRSASDEVGTYKPNSLYLDRKDAEKLLKQLRPRAKKLAIEKYRENKRKQETLFK